MNNEEKIDFTIDKTSLVPLYYQIYLKIKEAIDTKKFKAGEFMYSEHYLEKAFLVSRITIRKAIENLEKDGYLYKQQGKPTQVIYPKEIFRLSELNSFTDDMTGKDNVTTSILLDFKCILADTAAAEALKISVEKEVYYIKRLRLLNHVIIGLHECYIPKDIVELKESDFMDTNSSLYNILKQSGINIYKADETIEARIPDKVLLDLLEMDNKNAIFYRERITYDKESKPIEFVKMYYNANLFKYRIQLKSQIK
ncbi:GntR family transcriptional regulator [Brachyspira pilosicoli]|uniref:GntR family transcriptional regulator n=1 Tax=Brachyspira pilosicoli TaxID=52584 RepID=UPI0012F4C987|nr:GntR family transcriptional regulator [Brachyspira pilosicoli]